MRVGAVPVTRAIANTVRLTPARSESRAPSEASAAPAWTTGASEDDEPASNTERTPDIVAEVGFTYQTDWKIDDHPLPIKVRTGRLVCIPYTSELNDAPLTNRVKTSFTLMRK